MFAGKPVLVGIQGNAAELISDSEAGKIVESENPESMTREILQLFRMSDTKKSVIGKNGRKYYDKNLLMDAGVRSFANIFYRDKGAEKGGDSARVFGVSRKGAKI